LFEKFIFKFNLNNVKNQKIIPLQKIRLSLNFYLIIQFFSAMFSISWETMKYNQKFSIS